MMGKNSKWGLRGKKSKKHVGEITFHDDLELVCEWCQWKENFKKIKDFSFEKLFVWKFCFSKFDKYLKKSIEQFPEAFIILKHPTWIPLKSEHKRKADAVSIATKH